MSKTPAEKVKGPEDMVISGRALFLIMRKSGFSLKHYARALEEYKAVKGGKICTKRDTLQRALSRRALPDVYSTVLKQLVGKDVYQKWLETIYKDRPDLFSEATIL